MKPEERYGESNASTALQILTREKKRTMLREIIEATHKHAGSDPSLINVVLEEIDPEDYAINGEVA